MLKDSKKGQVLAFPKVAKHLTQRQSAERLFVWQSGDYGKAAQEKAKKEQRARKDRSRIDIYIT